MINCSIGNLTITQSGAAPTFSNTGTMTISTSATITGGTVSNSGAGLIRGSGTLDVSDAAFTNNATVSPGLSAGVLHITGDYSQTAPGTYVCELGGLGAGSGYDQLAITGAADLNGILDVSVIGGFVPADGDSFVVMTYGSFTGAFSDTSSLAAIVPGIDLVTDYQPTQLVLHAVAIPLADNVAPVDPEICITPNDPCLTIPFMFDRTVTTPVRAFTVTFGLSSGIELCNGLASITEGGYLADFCGGGCTVFQKNDNGDGTYTVDCAILGANCGPTSSPGDLFSIQVQSTASQATGTVNVTSVTIRDCNNAPVPGEPGPSIVIGIDDNLPVAIADLSVSQNKSGNDTDGTTGITVNFTTGETGIEVYRKGYGDYPEYQAGAVPAVPTDPADALANGWTLTGITATGQIDQPTTRDYWYYVAFVVSPCDLISAPSNMTGGTLNYHLGDVSDGVTPCQGDNSVGSIDISFLGANYFTSGPGVDPVNCLDVGPTDDFTPDGLPQTDNVIGFEDLLMFAINFGQVSRPVVMDTKSSDAPRLLLVRNGEVDGVFTARVVLDGNEQSVKGAQSVVAYDPTKLELVKVEAGSSIRRAVPTCSSEPGGRRSLITIDTAIMKRGRRQRIRRSRDPAVPDAPEPGSRKPDLVVADLRDLHPKPADRRRGRPDASGGRAAPRDRAARRTSKARRRASPTSGSSCPGAGASQPQVYDIAGRQVVRSPDQVPARALGAMGWEG
ncbi:MAG: hypothetical protein R3E12_00150 [Candidatus Eisenbacteria bacterium]